MIDTAALDRFLETVAGQALREGTRYAREARVARFVGSTESVSTVVRGQGDDYDVMLWTDAGRLEHRCTCRSWRDPCKHRVAAALALRQCLEPPALKKKKRSGPLQEARAHALEERRLAARRERLQVKLDVAPYLRVESASGFAYRVQLRGGSEGPHACACPDFEANRLHTCKHVERVRTWLNTARGRLPAAFRRAAAAPRAYLHFGEVIEPRAFGRDRGRRAAAWRAAFDDQGVPRKPLAADEADLLRWLRRLEPRVEPDAISWVETRLERRPRLPDGNFARLVPPLKLEPYPYQWTGAAFLARRGRALLADEMGLGKTVQAILAAAALRRAANPVRCVTVVCPASLRGGWQDEIYKWLGEEARLLEGASPQRAGVIAARHPWLVTHYEQLWRDWRHHQALPPDLLIVDEAQRAKGLSTRTARLVKTIEARYLFALTGTPLENRLEEAYSIAQLIDQRLLPPLWQIERDHFVRDGKGRRVVLYRGLDSLRSRLAPAFLRRRKEDVALELPERVRATLRVPMHPAVVDRHDEVLALVARIASKKVLLPADFERITRLLVIARRCCDGPHMLGLKGDDRQVPKLQELEQALRDLCLGEGRKAVVFSEWTDMTERVEALAARLRLPVFSLHGGVSVKARPSLIRAFTGQQGPAVFVSTDAGGMGLNLQAADVVVSLDLPWNPARLEQRIARVHRIGSRRTVQEILLVTENSVEARILALHETKRNVLANVWAERGEDEIAAPGGSGAFRDMVDALLRTSAPTGDPTIPDGRQSGRAKTPASQGATGRTGASSTPSVGRGNGQPAVATRLEAPTVRDVSVNPAAVAAAVAAIAPTLPPEHRRSLAVVFRTLAESLEV